MSNVYTELGISFSLKMIIQSLAEVVTEIHYDGIKYPEEPSFVIVRNRNSQAWSISKLREATAEHYRYQVSVFADTAYDLSVYRERLVDIFTYEDIPLYTQEGKLTERVIKVADDFMVVPLGPKELPREAEFHSVHFDIEIETTKYRANRRKLNGSRI